MSADDRFRVAAHSSNGWMDNLKEDVNDAFWAAPSAWGMDICAKWIPLADKIDYSVRR